MKKYFRDFFIGQNGVEIIEFVGLVVIAAILIGIAAGIGTGMASQGNSSANQMENGLNAMRNIK